LHLGDRVRPGDLPTRAAAARPDGGAGDPVLLHGAAQPRSYDPGRRRVPARRARPRACRFGWHYDLAGAGRAPRPVWCRTRGRRRRPGDARSFRSSRERDGLSQRHGLYIQRRELEKWAWAVSLPPAMDWLKQGVSIDDLAGLLHLAGEGRLRLVDGLCSDVFPGVSLGPDFDTPTYGHQHVVIRNESSGVWVVPGDVMYLYANIEGIGGDGRYVPIGLAMGSQENCLMSLAELMRVTGGQTSRILPGHEKLLWERHASRQYGDGLHVAEICLRPGEASQLPGRAGGDAG